MKPSIVAAIIAAAAGVILLAAALALYDTGMPEPISTECPEEMPAAIPQEAADANNSFAIDFYRQVLGGSDRNIFFSPASMHVAFSALYEGARSDTASQMEAAFGFEPDMQSRHDMARDMLSSVNRCDPHATLDMANSLWISEMYELHDSYMDTARDVYMAHVENVVFPDAADTINRWASENTNERIKNVLDEQDLSKDTLAVLANAIYFKGTWLSQFPKDLTAEGDFWTGTGNVAADFMRMEEPALFNYTKSADLQVLQLPYTSDRLSMVIVLPDNKDGIGALEEGISAGMVKDWQDGLRETEVDVSIPKFELRTKYNLIPSLNALGITDLFNSRSADLSGMADLGTLPGNIYVSDAVHDAYVMVNEEGTEAAAVTAVTVTIESAAPPVPRFIADHPFIFIIQDNESGAILFMGKIVNPADG